ncbi:uncharacterized protein, partial [Ptychodera flava]|uniref:uncharacterized protein n=1 Tax=Ptychodera flava TaxID=63121 RepID=UPI00396A6EAF
MLSTLRRGRRASTDSRDSVSGDIYSEHDRLLITAATDASIASVQAMGPSAFATGHQPLDKDTEAKQDSGRSDHSSAASSSSSTSSRKLKKAGKKNKPKKHMGNKALIVSNSWGGPIQGGVTDDVHILIRLLRALGLAVYCTTLTATEEEIVEARKYGVELIAPSPVPKFKARDGIPDPDWLYHHKDFFPNLKELANVRFVFGFGMITSEAAFEIERDVFKRAAFYLINMFDRDVITPVIANCMHKELNLRREKVLKEGRDSTAVFSVGGSIFQKYKRIYRKDSKIKHYRLSPMIDESVFKIPAPEPVDEDGEFQILSIFQDHELAGLKKDSVIVKAMNSMSESFNQTMKSCLKWKILGVSKRCESDVINCIEPHSKLHVVVARMPSAEQLNDELGNQISSLFPIFCTLCQFNTCSNVCCGSHHYSLGIPSHELIKRHLPEDEDRLVVDMSDANILKQRIMDFLCNYKIALKKANDIKTAIKNKVKQQLENINNDFMKVVKDDAEVKYGIILRSSAEKTQVRGGNKDNQKTELTNISRKRKMPDRDPGDIKVKVRVSEVVPENGRTVVGVERDFYESDEVKETTEEVGQLLAEQHDEIKRKDTGSGSISYTMSCQSLDALECLMRKYENGNLQDMMDDKFLSDELLDKIGAFYLAIDVTIDYEEYFLCRQELIQKYGLPTQERSIPKPDQIAPQRSDMTPGRANRARDLLKTFESEQEVTASQIKMLDQLLKEKEEKRLSERQQSLREPEQQICEVTTLQSMQEQHQDDPESTQMTDVHLLTDEEIEQKNEELESKVNELRLSSRLIQARNAGRRRGRDNEKSVEIEEDKGNERELKPLLDKFLQEKKKTQDLATNHPEEVMKTEKLPKYADHIVRKAKISDRMKKLYLELRRVERGYLVKGSVLEV